jgi:hypothetical protein
MGRTLPYRLHGAPRTSIVPSACCVLAFTELENDAAMRFFAFILRLLTPWTWFRWNVAAEPVPAPVQVKPSANSRASTLDVEPSEPVSSRTTSAPAPVQRLQPRPPAGEQAQALLEYLHGRYAGKLVCAADVKTISYPHLTKAMGWRARPWDGTDGVGAHLGRLSGRRTFAWFTVDGERKRQRAYLIPLAIAVHGRQAS